MHPQSQVPLIRKDAVVPETQSLWFHSSLPRLTSRVISDAKRTSLPMDPLPHTILGLNEGEGGTPVRARILGQGSPSLLEKTSRKVIIPSSGQMHSSVLPNT